MAKILIVDDAAFQRHLLKQIFTTAGYSDLLEADNSEDALKLCKKEKPDLMTLDVVMDKNSDSDLIGGLKSANPKVKIIMVTVMDQKNTIQALSKAGADAYITKPVDEKKFVATVKKLLK